MTTRDLADRLDALDPDRRALLERLRARSRREPAAAGVPRRAGRDTAPLSYAQERLWFLDQMSPGRPDYTVSARLRLTGDLEVHALRSAVRNVVSRHEVLRSVVAKDPSGAPQWHVLPATVDIPVVDLSAEGAGAEIAAAQHAAALASTGFDLAAGPLVRTRLLRVDPRTHHLLIAVHHIVCDGWSIGVFGEELGRHYRAELGLGSAPGPLPVQYGDFAAWQRDSVGPRIAGLAEQWIEHFGEALPQPPEFPPPPGGPGVPLRGVRHDLPLLDEGVLARLVGLADRERVTSSTVLFAAWAAVAGRLTGRDELLIGVPVANRQHADLEQLIGLFANTVVVRVDLRGDPTFRELVGRVRQSSLAAYDLQDLPFDRLVQALNPTRRAGSVTPLISLSFSAQDWPRQLDLPGLVCESLLPALSYVPIELLLTVHRDGTHLASSLEHAESVLDAGTGRAVAAEYGEVLEAAGRDPDRRLSAFPGRTRIAPARVAASAAPRTNLTQTQVQIWLGQQLYPTAPLYNQTCVVRIDAELDPARFCRAFDRLVAATDALRLRIRAQGGVPIQDADSAPGPLAVVDLSGAPDPDAALEAWVAEHAPRALDLGQRVFDSALLELGPGRWAWYLCVHHIATDGRSTKLLVQRLFRAYADLPVDAPAFLEHAAEQELWLASGDGRAACAYWQSQVVEPLPPVDFYGVPAASDTAVTHVTRTLRDTEVAALRRAYAASGLLAFSAEQEVSTALVAVTLAWLYRSTGRDRVGVGVTLHNRATRAERDTVGPLFSVVPVLATVSAETTYADLLRHVDDALRAGLPHASACSANRRGRRAYDAVVNLYDADVVVPGVPVRLSMANAGHEFDPVTLHAVRRAADGSLALSMDLQTGTFDAGRREQAARDFAALLAACAAEPATRVVLADLAEPEPRDAPAPYRPLGQAFLAVAAARPHAVAVQCGAASVTYAGLARRVSSLAAHLAERGVGVEESVLVLAHRCPQAIVALLACLSSGAAYTPVDPDWPAERIRSTVRTTGAAVALTTADLAPQLAGADVSVIDLDALPAWEGRPPEQATAEQLAGVLFTSGSTGEPKAVLVEHGGLARYTDVAGAIFGITERDRVLQFASLAFDASLEEILTTLLRGATLVIPEPCGAPTPREFVIQAVRDQLTVLDLPTAYWHVLALDRASGLGDLAGQVRLAIIGGEDAKPAAAAAWVAATGGRVALLNTYGAIEGTIVSSFAPLDGSRSPSPIGAPLPGVSIDLVTPGMCRVARGVAGEVFIAGFGVARGYLGRPGATAARFRPDPTRPGGRGYLPGDLARRDRDGALLFVGRVDRQLKIRGVRVEPSEIEAVLCEHPSVTGAVVLAQEAHGGQRLVAVVSAPRVPDTLPEELRYLARSRLPAAMVPASVRVVANLPRNASTKVDHAALAELTHALAPAASELSKPQRDEDERLVTAAWAELLDRPLALIGGADDFFASGGHSLLAVMLLSRLNEQAGTDLALRDLFANPTPAGIARALGRARATAATTGGALTLVGAGSPPGTPMPLTLGQRQMWLQNQLTPGDLRWNVPAAVRIRGEIDATALRAALAAVVDRHEALRTTFRWDDATDAPVQVVQPVAPDGIFSVEDIAQAEIPQRVAGEWRRSFDLVRGPLLRAVLLRCADSEHVLLLSMHHIIADGWSVGILVHDLLAAYQSLRRGEPPALAPLPVQFGDVARWQAQLQLTDRYRRDVQWWRERLADAPQSVPVGAPRAVPTGYTGLTHTFTLGPELVAGVHWLARGADASPFAVLLAAWAALLARASDATDLVIGTSVAGRDHPDTENLVGYLVNTLPLRIDVSGQPTSAALLDRCRDTVRDALNHRHVGFDDIVAAVNPGRNASQGPLFNVMFTFLNEPTRKLLHDAQTAEAGLAFEVLDLDRGFANRDLTLRIEDADPRGTQRAYRAHLEARTSLFTADAVRDLAAAFTRLLTAAIGDPERPLVTAALAGQTYPVPVDPLPHATNRAAARARFQRGRQRSASSLDLSAPDLVAFAEPVDGLPLVATPLVHGVDAPSWARANRAELTSRLWRHGAVLLRGFKLRDAAEFEELAGAVTGDLSDYDEASTPRRHVSGRVYTSTEYPPDATIGLHNEMAYAHHWPATLAFWCRQPASEGGSTPIADSRAVLALLDPGLVARARELGMCYQRTFSPDLDLPWQTVFATDEPSVAEETCHAWGMTAEWVTPGVLRTTAVRHATATHPHTNEEVWFNSAHMFHVAALPPDVRASLHEDELPRNATFGDGTRVPDDAIEHIHEVYRRAAKRFEWRQGDVLLVDNMLAAHGRDPYSGPRQVLVALGPFVQT